MGTESSPSSETDEWEPPPSRDQRVNEVPFQYQHQEGTQHQNQFDDYWQHRFDDR